MIDLATDPATRIIEEAERIIRDALDDFAGTGWGVALQRLGIEEHGVEIMPEAVATREANGMRTIYRDVWDGLLGWEPTPIHQLYLSSPPCQTFSVAGSGDGRRALDDVLAAVERGDWRDPSVLFDLTRTTDPRTALVLVPLARVFQNLPLYVAFEQVPPVLPVWEACAEVMRAMGYSVWVGYVYSEQYGVAQTRKRAVLIARRDGILATMPTPTHSKFHAHDPARLDAGVAKWVSMAERLGWGMTARPYYTIAAGTSNGGVDPLYIGGSRPRSSINAEREAGRWVLQSNYSTTPRDGLTPPPGNALPRGEREMHEPASTLTSKLPRWTNGDEYLRLTDAEASALQSYPDEFKWIGRRGPIAQQIGNAVPPLMAEAIIRGFLP